MAQQAENKRAITHTGAASPEKKEKVGKTKLALHRIKVWLIKSVKAYRVPIDLSIHACEHCNLNCAGCTPYSPLAEPEFCNLDVLDRSLQSLSRFEKSFGHIKIVGGEPLLNPDLGKMLAIVRRHFKTVNICVWTNGILLQHPEKMPPQFWESCRDNNIEIRLTRYPIKLDYEAIEETCRKHGVALDIFADRTYDGGGWSLFHLHENGGGIKAYRYKWLKFMRCQSFNCMQLADGKIFPCAQSAHVRHLNKAFGTDFRHRKGDYLETDKIKNVCQIRKMLFQTAPFCYYCGKGYIPTKWKISERKRDEWLAPNS